MPRSDYHRVNFQVPITSFVKLKTKLPFKGEVTNFLNLCIESAIREDAPDAIKLLLRKARMA